MADNHHTHGSMDIRGHEKTFAGFVKWSTWVGIAAICVVIFMALSNA